MSKKERLLLLKEYLEQALENTLKEVDIHDKLKVIEAKEGSNDEDEEKE